MRAYTRSAKIYAAEIVEVAHGWRAAVRCFTHIRLKGEEGWHGLPTLSHMHLVGSPVAGDFYVVDGGHPLVWQRKQFLETHERSRGQMPLATLLPAIRAAGPHVPTDDEELGPESRVMVGR